jgi:hypothetical protein
VGVARNVAQSRWTKARADSGRLAQVWKRDFAFAISAAVLTIVALVLFGSSSVDISDELIVLGIFLMAIPVAHFGMLIWNYLWAPWNLLVERVDGLASAAHSPPTAEPSSPPAGGMPPQTKVRGVATQAKYVQAQLQLLHALENELRAMEKGGTKALKQNDARHFEPTRSVWIHQGSTVSGQNNWQKMYRELRETYETVQDMGYWPSMGLMSDEQKKKLKALLPQLKKGLDAVNVELKKITG